MQHNLRETGYVKDYSCNATGLRTRRVFLSSKTKYLIHYAISADFPVIGKLFKSAVIVSVSASLGLSVVHAEETGKETRLPAVVVTIGPFESRNELDMAQPVTVLKGSKLRRKREVSLGDTLSSELGIASSSFGPGAGRPIIRALDGPRIQVLENGIGTNDISSLSPDHAVTVELLNASQIEILRGPATLLYGGGVSAGVVNVVTNRIPNQIFNSLKGNFEARGNTATKERAGAFNASGSIGRHISLSVSGFRRKTSDYSIPGRSNKNDPNSKKNVVKNSAVNSGGGAIGGSFVGERGFLGGSVSHLESKYGIPSPEGSKIDLQQTRYDLAGELDNPITGFDKLKVRISYNDYKHNEIESTGILGTRFKNRGLESRTELLHAPIANWKGVLGVQFKDRNFSALGDEAIVPRTKSRSTGLFLVEERNWNRLRLEFGGRFEHASQDPQSSTNQSRKFNLYSFSVGVLWKFIDGYGVSLSATRGQRAPATEELYTNGAHPATATFQTGNQALTKETSNNIDFSLHKTSGVVKWKANFFYNRFNNYIFYRNADIDGNGVADRVDENGMLDPNGEFLVQNIAQTGATFYGAEAEVIFTLRPDTLDLRLFTDYVRAKLDNDGNVPRTTPQRFGLEFNHSMGPWSFNLTTIHVLRQNRRAKLETSTPDYTLINVAASYLIKETKSIGITVFLQGKNLLNEEIRVHTSFLKDFAPLPGRTLIVGIRGEF